MNEGFCRLVSDHLIQAEVRAERWRLMRDIVIGLVAFVVLCVAATKDAHSETLKFENGNATVRLLDKPCELDVPAKEKLKAASGTFSVYARTPYGMLPLGKEDHKGCWLKGADGYYTEWDDGEKIKFPFEEFKVEGV